LPSAGTPARSPAARFFCQFTRARPAAEKSVGTVFVGMRGSARGSRCARGLKRRHSGGPAPRLANPLEPRSGLKSRPHRADGRCRRRAVSEARGKRCCRSVYYLQTGWPLTTAMLFPCGHPFGCGGTTLGATGRGTGLAAAAAGATGFAPGGGVTGLAGLAPPPGGGDGDAVTGLVGAGSDDGVAGFPAGTCAAGVAGLALPPGGVIAADGVVGVERFAAGVCCGVAGLALPPGADDGAAGVTAAEGVGVDGFAAGVCGVAGLALPPRADDGAAGVIAAEGVVGVTGVPVADGRGCPFIPGNGWPG
jgi:hypothetical protein